MASADFTINGSATPPAVEVAASSSVTLALVSITGARTIVWSIIGNHSSTAVNPTITPAGSPLGASATFPMPSGSGQAYLVQCQINGGSDDAGQVQSTYTKTALVGVVNDVGLLPFAVGETFERSVTHGYTEALNDFIGTPGPAGADGADGPAGPAGSGPYTRAGSSPGVTVTHTGVPTAGQAGGVTLSSGDRFFDKDNSTKSLRGVWVVAAGAWARATEASSSAQFTSGLLVTVGEGTEAGAWQMTTSASGFVLGTTGLDFVKVADQYVATQGTTLADANEVITLQQGCVRVLRASTLTQARTLLIDGSSDGSSGSGMQSYQIGALLLLIIEAQGFDYTIDDYTQPYAGTLKVAAGEKVQWAWSWNGATWQPAAGGRTPLQ